MDVANVTESPFTPADLSGSLGQYTEFWVALFLNQYYPWCLCVLGLFCNGAVFATTMLAKPFNTSSLHVALLAVVDTLALISKLLYTVLTANNVAMGDAGCSIIMMVGFFLVQFAIWILAVITVERFIAVYFVFKVSSLVTMSRARLSLFVVAVTLLAADAHLLWTIQEVQDPVTGLQCGFRPEYAQFGQAVWYWIDAVLAFLLPCACLIVLNTLILVKMKTRHVKRMSMFEGKNDSAARMRHQSRQLTNMLVTVSVGTACLLLPISVFYIASLRWEYTKSPHQTAVYLLVTNIVHLLADCSHAMNFFFCLLGGGRFRKVLRRILCTCSGHKNKLKKQSTKYDSRSTSKSFSRQSCTLTSVTFISTGV